MRFHTVLAAKPAIYALVLCLSVPSMKAVKAIPRVKAVKPPAASGNEAIKIDAIQPLFLNAVKEKQTIHLVGSFPEGTVIKADTTPLLPVTGEQSISKEEIFVNVMLNDTTEQTVFLTLQVGATSTSIAFQVSSACGPRPKPAASVASSLAPPGNGRCQLPADNQFVAVNAMTEAVTSSGNTSFCNQSSAGTSDGFDLKSTYRATRDRVHFVICNKNPFAYSTTLRRDEVLIKDDDLSTFLGVLVPGLGASQAAKTATNAASTKSTAGTTTKTNKPAVAGTEGVAPPAVPHTFTIADPTQSCLKDIATQLDTLDTDYDTFVRSFLQSESKLQDDSLTCTDRLSEAQKLWTEAKTLSLDSTTGDVYQRIAELTSTIDARIADAQSGPYAGNNLTKQQISSLQAVETALDVQTCIASKSAQILSGQLQKNVLVPLESVLGDHNSFVYSTFFGPYQQPTSVTWSVQSSKIDKASTLSASTDTGTDPYNQCLSKQNPASATPVPNGTAPSNTNATPNATQPTQDAPAKSKHRTQANSGGRHTGGEHGISESVVGDEVYPRILDASFPAGPDSYFELGTGEIKPETQDAPQGPGTSDPGGGAPKQNPTNTTVNATPSGSQTAAKTAGEQIGSGVYLFGGPRVTVSVGIATVLLRNREFQNIKASGQSSGTTVEYSTNSEVRMSPLIMAHGRIYSFKGRDNAIWGTLGVTAASSSKGVSAEYLFGATTSFLNNWIFATPGVYVGQSQALTGGYAVGQQLPSTFSGNLPIQKGYKAGFGLAISFRVPGTAAPKTKTSAPTTNTAGTTNSKGTAKKSP